MRAVFVFIPLFCSLIFNQTCHADKEPNVIRSVPENLYSGELVSYPGPWSFMLGRSGISRRGPACPGLYPLKKWS